LSVETVVELQAMSPAAAITGSAARAEGAAKANAAIASSNGTTKRKESRMNG